MEPHGETARLGLRKVNRALISVSDKTGVKVMAAGLRHNYRIDLWSTGGTRAHIEDAGVLVDEVSNLTGFPEMMDGRLKTLHPKVHGGLLGVRSNPAHLAAMKEHGIPEIDLLIVNLYPFSRTVDAGRPYAECVENIDIGGPAMLRAAAKNHEDVAVVVDPADYTKLMEELDMNRGYTTLAFRRQLAAKAFGYMARYDTTVAVYMAQVVPRLNAAG